MCTMPMRYSRPHAKVQFEYLLACITTKDTATKLSTRIEDWGIGEVLFCSHPTVAEEVLCRIDGTHRCNR